MKRPAMSFITKDFAEFLAVMQYASKYGSCKPENKQKAINEFYPIISSNYVIYDEKKAN